MQTAARSNLFLTEFSSIINVADIKTASKQGEFYQQFVQGLIKGAHTNQALIQVGDKLVALAEHAYQLRQMEAVEQVSQLLLSLPLPREYESVASYYQALCIKRQGQAAEACALLERVADKGSLRYRARAMQSLGAVFIQSNNFQYAVPFCVEAIRAADHIKGFDLLTVIPAQQVIAIFKSIDGDHRGALTTLKNLFPLIRALGASHPPMYYAYLNSLAVEMTELGQLKEARYLSNIALASPYAFAYPEWRETSDDIERKGYRASRSFVPIIQGLQHNIIRLPERENISVSQSEPARILHYDWKNRMVKEPNGDQSDDTSLDEMTNKDLIIEIVQRTSNKDMSENKLRKILEYGMEVESEPED